MSFDPYAELQLSPDAEPELIKAAFKALAKKYHPDKFSDPVEKKRAEEKMARINEAQQLLASGKYRPPHQPQVEPSRPVPPKTSSPPPPATPSATNRSVRPRTKVGPIVAAALVLVILMALPKIFAEDNLKKALQYEKEGRLQDSLTYLNEAVEENPHDRELYRHRARIWEKLGEPDKAATDLSNAKLPELRIPTSESTSVPASESPPNQVPPPPGENSDSHVP